jgi:hypothetical protein
VLRKTLLLLSTASLILFANTNLFIQKLPFQEGIVEYTLSGNQKGVKTLYVRNYGLERVLYQHTSNKLANANKEIFTLQTTKWLYNINPKTKEAVRIPNLAHLLYIAYQDLTLQEQKQVQKNLYNLNFLPLECTTFSVTKNYTKVQNISCDLLTSQGKKDCYAYRGALLLKSSVKALGFNKDEIASHIFKTKVDPKLFDTSSLKVIDDKVESIRLYALSKKIITMLKTPIDPKKIFTNLNVSPQDYNQIIQEGIKALDNI